MKQALSYDIREEEAGLQEIVLFCGIPSLAISLAECIYRVLHQTFFSPTRLGPVLLFWGPLVLAIGLLIPIAFVAFRRGREAILACAAGFILAMFVAQHFRGSWIWQGTFDQQDRSLAPLAVAFVSAFVGAWAISVVLRIKVSQDWPKWPFAALACIALVWVFLDSQSNINSYSFFAYTREIGVGAISLVAIACLAYERFA